MKFDELPLDVLHYVFDLLGKQDLEILQFVSRRLYPTVALQLWGTVALDLTFACKKTRQPDSYFLRHHGESFRDREFEIHDLNSQMGMIIPFPQAARFVKFCQALFDSDLRRPFYYTRVLTIVLPHYIPESVTAAQVSSTKVPRGYPATRLIEWLLRSIPQFFPQLAHINISTIFIPDPNKSNRSLYSALVGSLSPIITQSVLIDTSAIRPESIRLCNADDRHYILTSESTWGQSGTFEGRELAPLELSERLVFLRLVFSHASSNYYVGIDGITGILQFLTRGFNLPQSLQRLDFVCPDVSPGDTTNWIYNRNACSPGFLSGMIERLYNLKELKLFGLHAAPSGSTYWIPPQVTTLSLTDCTEISASYPNITSFRKHARADPDLPGYKPIRELFPNLRKVYLDHVSREDLSDLPDQVEVLRVMHTTAHWRIIKAACNKRIPQLVIENPFAEDVSPKTIKAFLKENGGFQLEVLQVSSPVLRKRKETMLLALSTLATNFLLLTNTDTLSSATREFQVRVSGAYGAGLCCNLVDTIRERGGQNNWTKAIRNPIVVKIT